MATLIEKSNVSDARVQGAPSQVGGGSSGSDSTQRTYDRTTRPSRRGSKLKVKGVTGACVDPRKPRRRRRTLAVLASLMCLVLILLPTYAGVASAQEKTSEESLVEGMVANLNAYWEEQFRLLGHPYSSAELVFLYDHELFLGPCGLAFTGLGPGY